MAVHYPPVFINNYLAETIPSMFDSQNYFSGAMKFFPTQPTSIDALTEEFPESSDEVFAVYDRMFRLRRKSFPHCRVEQLLYYFYKTAGSIEALIETSQAVQDLLDNGDESATDLNYWIQKKYNADPQTTPVLPREIELRLLDYTQGMNTTQRNAFITENSVPTAFVTFGSKQFFLPYFYEIKLFHLEESRDIIDLATARTYAANKLILEYMWHK